MGVFGEGITGIQRDPVFAGHSLRTPGVYVYTLAHILCIYICQMYMYTDVDIDPVFNGDKFLNNHLGKKK